LSELIFAHSAKLSGSLFGGDRAGWGHHLDASVVVYRQTHLLLDRSIKLNRAVASRDVVTGLIM